ncbi:GDSL esterase/lipase At1g29660-like [Bidens hawaiensis]|uniref:GDSL esterase/lipase At1g29660-like n=1 Tax=Bidens hawaiensis TaxID=980011 RepID=UPI00404AC069
MASNVGLLFRALVMATMMQFQTILVIGAPQVPCYFIFGDSLVNNGNNNNLQTQAKADYQPYGIDFPPGPTGRFSNGRTTVDFVTESLGIVDIAPYATATNDQISMGVNYGSGAAGIRAETGNKLGDRISLDKQLRNHESVVSRLRVLQRNRTFTNEYLSKCIYSLAIGSNDYVNNYFMPDNYPAGRIYTPDQFASKLIEQYSQQLSTLYKFGARKIAAFGLSLLGCTPFEIQMFGTNGQCVESINEKVQLFNDRLKPLIDDLNSEFSDARFTFINVTGISALQNVVFPKVPCCQLRADGQLCAPNSVACLNRNLYAYFDGLHPTEVINRVLATRAYIALSPTDAIPYDIKSLASLIINI